MSSIAVERRTVDLPDDVTVTVDGDDVIVEGPEGTIERQLHHPEIEITVEDDEVVVLAE